MKCRHCSHSIEHTFLDLGYAPPSNAYLNAEDMTHSETYYPLRVMVCSQCFLVQTEDHAEAEALFDSDYAYFSSTSKSWLAHSAAYSKMIIDRLHLKSDSLVVELASNDGYLLKNFVGANIPCLGIEPTRSTADAAEALGIPVLRQFFTRKLGEELSQRGQQADLIIGNNVYAHVPDINDFTSGMKALLKHDGVITLEFPHLMRLVEKRQFDTIYHEHFSYLSFAAVSRIFAKSGLRIFDVEELPTHGGSLRVYGCHVEAPFSKSKMAQALEAEEFRRGMGEMEYYRGFQATAVAIKNQLLRFLLDAAAQGKKIAAYGAAAKGNTLLNFAGIRPDLLPVVYDAAPSKIGRFMPGSHIPILSPDLLERNPPDFLLILPWNIADEIRQQTRELAKRGMQYVTAIPQLEVS